MNAIVSSGNPHETWVSAFDSKLMSEIQPVYWISDGNIDKDHLKSTFPNLVHHDAIDCIHGRFPEPFNFNEPFPYPLDKKLLRNFSETQVESMKMMDRMDPGNVIYKNFTYIERVRHYHRLLSHWLRIISDLEINVAIFSSTPHMISDFIMYSVCKYYDIDTLIIEQTHLPGIFVAREHIHQMKLQSPPLSSDPNIPSRFQSHISDIRSNKTKPIHVRRKHVSTEKMIFFKIRDIIKEMMFGHSTVSKLKQPKYLKNYNGPVEESQMNDVSWFMYRLKSLLYKRKLKKYYSKLSMCPNLDHNYIYFPLHYQPEKTSSPMIEHLSHQYLIANLLSHELPSGYFLYVKEHPSQFSPMVKGEQGRTFEFYDDLQNLDSTKLIDYSWNNRDLIDSSLAVATGTGFSGWEALLRGKKVLSFGTSWYGSAKGCYNIESGDDLRMALDSIIEDPLQESNITNLFVANFVNNSYDLNNYLNDKNPKKSMLIKIITDQVISQSN